MSKILKAEITPKHNGVSEHDRQHLGVVSNGHMKKNMSQSKRRKNKRKVRFVIDNDKTKAYHHAPSNQEELLGAGGKTEKTNLLEVGLTQNGVACYEQLKDDLIHLPSDQNPSATSNDLSEDIEELSIQNDHIQTISKAVDSQKIGSMPKPG